MTDKKDLQKPTKDSVENVESPERREFLTQSLKAGPAVYAGSRLPFFATVVLSAKQALAQYVPFAFWKNKTTQNAYAWGSNFYGQLGIAAAGNRSIPVQVVPLASWTSLAGSGDNSAGIRTDSTLYVWGHNSYGQIGIGTSGATNYSSPMQVGGSWNAIASNGDYHLAIRSDKTLWAWGCNSYGQIGVDNYTHYSSPVQVSTSLSFRAVVPGYETSAALDFQDRLWVWGNNINGQLGMGYAQNLMAPLSSSWTEIAGGRNHFIGERAGIAQNLFTWGDNTFGQLGQGDALNNTYMSPTLVANKSVISVAAGGDHNLAVTSDGKLWVWGQNSFGQLGTADTNDRSSPVQVMDGTSFAKVGAGKDFSFAIDNTGILWSAGNNSFGQCGFLDPSAANKIAGSWLAVAVGSQSNGTGHYARVLAIRAGDKSLWGWGDNGSGELGLGDTVNRSAPVQISALSWNQVFAISNQTYAQRADGVWFTAGYGLAGDLPVGYGDYASRSQLVQLGGTAGVSFVSISGNISQAVGITADGRAFYWGNTDFGQSLKASSFSPNVVSAGAGLSWIAAMGGYYNFGAGIKSDRTLWTWGQQGGVGQMGVGDTRYRFSPSQVPGSWVTYSMGKNHIVGIKGTTSGTLWTCGEAFNLALGVAGSQRSAPVQVGTSANWIMADAGFYMNAALNAVGEIWVWGRQYSGGAGYGLGDAIDRSFPTLIPGTANWTNVAVGSDFMLGIRSDGTLWSWGYNSFGQLGTGDAILRQSPVQVGSSTNWAAVYAGKYNGFARTTDDRMYAFGMNHSGMLGLGDTTHRSSPAQIPGSWIFAASSKWGNTGQSAGASAFVKSDGSLWIVGTIPGSANTYYVGLGLLDGTNNLTTLTQTATGTSFTSVSVGHENIYGLTTDNKIISIGRPSLGQSGTGHCEASPTQIDGSWISIGVAEHAIGIKSDYTVWAWGNNSYGQLGTGDKIWRFSPVQLALPAASYIQAFAHGWSIASGNFVNGVSGVVRSDGQVLMWGNNGFGQMGIGDTVSRSSPVAVGATVSSLVIANHTVILKSDSTLWLAGANSVGMLGTGDFSNRSSIVQIGGSWSKVAVGRTQTAAINSAGELFVWGSSANGALGRVANSTSWNTVATTARWTKVIGGDAHSIGIDTANNVYTWGLNSSGQCGRPDKAIRSAPVAIGTGLDVGVTALSSYIIRMNNQLWVMGSNSFGQLGTSNTTHYSSPMQVGGSWNALGTGPNATHIYATRSDNSIWSWGLNNQYQLGDASTINRSSPVSLFGSTGLSFTQLRMTSTAGALIESNGRLWTFGENQRGVLGFGRSTHVPGQVPGSWAMVACGQKYMAGIRNDGTLWLWGTNDYGQLGTGDVVDRYSAVQVNGGGSWNFVACGTYSTYAKKTDGTWWVWGSNATGQLGLNVGTAGFSTPQALAASYTSIIAGANHAIGYISSTKQAWAFGFNGNGNLGIGDTSDRSSPVQLSGQWSLLASGMYHSLGLK